MTDSPKVFEAGFIESIEQSYPCSVLKLLLQDHTTNNNIIWADDEYEALGNGYLGKDEITVASITGLNSGIIKPRIAKEYEKQSQRTRAHAEVFTPSWLCNQMNNDIDSEWFGRSNVFNTQAKDSWTTNQDNVDFPNQKSKSWTDYIDCRKLEITCGEAPFICSRYDTVSGDEIPVKDRIGFLDRKLRIVSENTQSCEDWATWAMRALESTYGYEYQGDNLVIARINVLQTLVEHMQKRWDKQPSDSEIKHAARIIAWNIWQMDGLKGTVPSDKPVGATEQMSIFEISEEPNEWQAPFCKIFDWRARKSQTYVSMKNEGIGL